MLTIDQARVISDQIVALVTTRDHVTFPEIQRHLNGIMETRGQHAIESTVVPNLLLWAGLSDDLSTVIRQLIKDKRIFLHPSSVLIHTIDGMLLTFPIAKRVPKSGGFKEPHWEPCCFRVVPAKTSKRKQSKAAVS